VSVGIVDLHHSAEVMTEISVTLAKVTGGIDVQKGETDKNTQNTCRPSNEALIRCSIFPRFGLILKPT
jgi:hypothetical protein